MKILKDTTTYKIYTEGSSFLKDWSPVLNKDINSQIQTTFFILNANHYHRLDKRNYAISIENEKQYLLILKCEPYNALVYGSFELVDFAASILIEHHFIVDKILAEEKVGNSFLEAYQKRAGGQYHLVHSMQILVLSELTKVDTKGASICKPEDLDILAQMNKSFYKEALHQELSIEEAKKNLKDNVKNFFVYKVNEAIVSMASIVRGMEGHSCISHVYTLPDYRGYGYAKKVVARTCEEILKNKKIPYLFVDNANPIAYHIYTSLGFSYLIDQAEYQYIK